MAAAVCSSAAPDVGRCSSASRAVAQACSSAASDAERYSSAPHAVAAACSSAAPHAERCSSASHEAGAACSSAAPHAERCSSASRAVAATYREAGAACSPAAPDAACCRSASRGLEAGKPASPCAAQLPRPALPGELRCGRAIHGDDRLGPHDQGRRLPEQYRQGVGDWPAGPDPNRWGQCLRRERAGQP